MMPEEGGGDFDGGGSVRWEVVTVNDDGAKNESLPDGPGKKGRKSKGVDKADGTIFRIVLKVPEDGSAAAFLAQFNVKPDDGEIVIFLNREPRAKQIRVQWPTTGGATSI